MNIKDEISRIVDVEINKIRNSCKARIDERDMEIKRLQDICKRNGLGWKKGGSRKVAKKSMSI